MSLETGHDKDDLAALDSLFHKYGSSSAAQQKKKQLDSEGAVADVPQAPSKSFLQEIQERAEILSRQRERTAKKTLHTVVTHQSDQSQENLDDIVKLIRSAPIEDDSLTLHHQSTPASKQDTKAGLEEGSFDYWSSQYTKPTLWDIETEESKDYESDSESKSTCTEETDTEDTNSDASELDFTWELNTEHPYLDSKQDTNDNRSSGYFELESLDDLGPSAGHISDGYFHLSSIDDNHTMADGNEPPIPVPDNDGGIVALSDDEQVPSTAEGAFQNEDDHVMDVDDSKKSFKATLGDEKAIDGFIDNVSDAHNTSAGRGNDDVVSGDETSANKAPSEEEDWVMLPKSTDVESKPMDVRETSEEHQDKKRKIEDDNSGVMEKMKKDYEDSDDEVDESRLPPPDLGPEEEEEEDEDRTRQFEDDDDEDDDDDDVIKGSMPGSITDDVKDDSKEEKEQIESKEEDEPAVVLRQKPQGSINPSQRYSLPEFDIFDNAKRLDTGILKSRARLGKQGALAQRRKPTKQDPSKRQTWMFGDPNDTKHLLNLDNIEEEAEKSHSRSPRKSEPYDTYRNRENDDTTSPTPKPRKPVGGIGGPMLLAGLGGPHMLKKTPKKSPLEDKPLAIPQSHDNDDDEPPIPKPRHKEHKTSPPKTITPATKTEITPSKVESSSGKVPPPKLIKPKPARPSPASKPPKPNQSPAWAKPKPKPRPASSVDGVHQLNHEILSAQRAEEQKEEVPKVPAWMADAKMRLPPISPRTDEDSTSDGDSKSEMKQEGKPAKKPVPVPQWKQELMKKKMDGGPKRHSMPPPVAKKPDAGGTPFTTMPQWQMDLAEKKNLRKKKEAEIGSREETPKIPEWKREAAERAVRVQKAQEEKAKKDKEREEKARKEKEEKARKEKEEKEKQEKDKSEKEKKEESVPLSTMQTTSSTPAAIIKNNVDDSNEKKDKPKHATQWKGDNHEKTKKNKNTENKAPKVLTKKPVLSPKPKPSAVPARQTNNDDTPQWKKDLVKKRKVSDWRSRLRSASIDQEPTSPKSPTSKSNNESNKFNENEQNSTSDKDSKRHTICTITVPDN